MAYNIRRRLSAWTGLVVVMLAIALISGCGPSGGDDGWSAVSGDTSPGGSANGASSDENEEAEGIAGDEDVDSGVVATGLRVAPGTQELDDAGIPVGFTSEGFAFRGDPEAPIVMEEYSDYQCPFCSRFVRETLPFLEEDQIRGGEVVLVFYDFPLPSHPQAPEAHEAAYCAGEEGAAAYWAMHDVLFEKLGEWSEQENTADLFSGYANDIGVNVEQFRDCLDNGIYAEKVEQSVRAAAQRGVNSTPSFFINGQALTGAQPVETFNQAIETVRNGGQLSGAPSPPSSPPPGVAPTPVAINDEAAATMGDPDAPVTIVEFTDYQCPYCARHAEQTLPQLIQQYVESGEVYYVVKDFPLDNIHPMARSAAAAARCAGEQDAYWSMHDELFARQSLWSDQATDSRDVFLSIATELGLDVGAFEDCVESGRYDDEVEANFAEGRALGVSATPTFYINGYPVPGAQSLQIFDFAIGLATEGNLGEAYVQPEPEPTRDPNQPANVPLGDAPRIGDPDAPVVIVEYTDYQCPYCSRHFQQTYPKILENFVETGVVLYVFKDFPLANIHPQAQLAAEAARCAGDQSAYADMHDVLFARQSEWNNRSDAAQIFTAFAGELDLDTATFAECLDSGQHTAAVQADQEEGSRLGIRGTPGFFINGHFLSGAQPYQVFEQAIQHLATEAD